MQNIYHDIGRLLTGRMVQIATTTATGTTTENTGNYTDAMTLNFTPMYGNSKVIVIGQGTLQTANLGGMNAVSTLRRGTTDLSSGTGLVQVAGSGTNDVEVPCTMVVIDSPGTTSQVAYHVSIKGVGGLATWRGANEEWMIAIEVAQ